MGRGCEEGKEEDTVERQQDVGSREPILEEVQQNHKALKMDQGITASAARN